MKVKELIEKLQEYPEDMELIILNNDELSDVIEIHKRQVKTTKGKSRNYYYSEILHSEYDDIDVEETDVVLII